jgi:hypothetical protein
MKPEVDRIFNDLDDLLDYCRFELREFNPADLYNRSSKTWRDFEWYQRKFRNKRYEYRQRKGKRN